MSNPSRVLADGCFDPLHIGHIKYLATAATYGDLLIVQIAPDTAIREKGRQPFQSQAERAMTVLSLGVVDLVRCYDSLVEAIRSECPRYLIKGREWRGQLSEDVGRACEETETDVIFSDTRQRSSTERLRSLGLRSPERV